MKSCPTRNNLSQTKKRNKVQADGRPMAARTAFVPELLERSHCGFFASPWSVLDGGTKMLSEAAEESRTDFPIHFYIPSIKFLRGVGNFFQKVPHKKRNSLFKKSATNSYKRKQRLDRGVASSFYSPIFSLYCTYALSAIPARLIFLEVFLGNSSSRIT